MPSPPCLVPSLQLGMRPAVVSSRPERAALCLMRAAVPVVSARSMGVLEPVSGQWAPDDARPTPPELASPGGAAQPPAESGALVEAGGGTEAEDRMLFPVGTVAVVLQVQTGPHPRIWRGGGGGDEGGQAHRSSCSNHTMAIWTGAASGQQHCQ